MRNFGGENITGPPGQLEYLHGNPQQILSLCYNLLDQSGDNRLHSGKWIFDLEYISISKLINAPSLTVKIFCLRKNHSQQTIFYLRMYLYFQHTCFNGQYESTFYERMVQMYMYSNNGFPSWHVHMFAETYHSAICQFRCRNSI